MKPTIPDILPLCQELYTTQPTGCCLHITLDDQNIETGHILFCLNQANGIHSMWIEGRGWCPIFGERHELCFRIADMLLDMSMTQRRKLTNNYHRYGWAYNHGGVRATLKVQKEETK